MAVLVVLHGFNKSKKDGDHARFPFAQLFPQRPSRQIYNLIDYRWKRVSQSHSQSPC